jgi:hypothetical protein
VNAHNNAHNVVGQEWIDKNGERYEPAELDGSRVENIELRRELATLRRLVEDIHRMLVTGRVTGDQRNALVESRHTDAEARNALVESRHTDAESRHTDAEARHGVEAGHANRTSEAQLSDVSERAQVDELYTEITHRLEQQ